MSNNNPIEKQFKDAFEHFEADVNPQVWANIEQQLPNISMATSNPASISKGIMGSSKIATWGFGIASTLIIAIVAVNYLSTEPTVKTTEEIANGVAEIVAPTPIENSSDIKANDNTIKSESKIEAEREVIVAQKKSASQVTSVNNATVYKTEKIIAEQPSEEKATEIANTKNTDFINNTDHIPSISSADEKHENISPPAIDTTSTSAFKSEAEKEFDWGVIPNAFSPNADGKNDVFKISNPNIETIKVTIIDRSGKQVHEWNGINGFWDGKDINGIDLPKGVYYYFIFATSVKQVAIKTKGTITLLR